MDGSRHGGAQPPLDYTFNVHHKGANGDDGPYPIRHDSTGSFPEDFPGDSPYGSVGGSLVSTCAQTEPTSWRRLGTMCCCLGSHP